MLERFDLEFAEALGREIEHILHGVDAKDPGLYRNVLSCQSWDDINQLKGKIRAYEDVLGLMEMLIKRFNENNEPVPFRRA